jgi:hypothetical protein
LSGIGDFEPFRYRLEKALKRSDGAKGDGLEWQRTVIIDRFYERYLAAASQVGENYRADKNRLGKRLIKILNVERDRQMVNGQRHYVWVFPSLEVCRLRFAKYMEADHMAWPEAGSAVTTANDPTPKSRKW